MRQAVEAFLETTAVIDWHDPAVSAAARRLRGTDGDAVSMSRRCFEFVRDEIKHTQDHRLSVVTLRASEVLAAGSGFSAMWLRVESAVRLSSSADE